MVFRIMRSTCITRTRCSKDSDEDGVPDMQEVMQGTNPKAEDTDGDGIADADDPAPRRVMDSDGRWA